MIRISWVLNLILIFLSSFLLSCLKSDFAPVSSQSGGSSNGDNPPQLILLSPGAGDQDQSLSGRLVAQDENPDGLTYQLVDQPRNGNVQLSTSTGDFTITPSGGWSGDDFFTYRVVDENGKTSTLGTYYFSVYANIDIPIDNVTEPPATLSETGLFHGIMGDLRPHKDLEYFEINQPLWTDFAQKKRWFYLPPGTSITFTATGPWAFPVGTILVKHFEMELSAGVNQRIETRILVRNADVANVETWIGYTYQWNNAGTDADLIADGNSPQLNITTDATAIGGARVDQLYTIPSRANCVTCHNSTVGFVRGLKTRQANRMGMDGIDQLFKWNLANKFSSAINAGGGSAYEKFVKVDDIMATLEERTKTYLSVNCSHCHNLETGAPCPGPGVDLRYDSSDMAVLAGNGWFVADDAAGSLVVQRTNTIGGGRMPLIGSNVIDDEAVQLFTDYINDEL